MQLTTLQQTVKTMSSLEIAELTGKRHDNVMADIRKMLSEIELNAPDFLGTYKTTQGNEYPCFYLPKRETIILVSGYNIKMRTAIIDRWDELERQAQQPKELSRFEILQLAMQAEQENIELRGQLAIAQPKAQALDVISTASNSLNIRETAKTLGIQEKKFINWCINHDWLYRDTKGKLCPIAHRVQNRFLEQRAVSYNKPNGEIGVSTQAMFSAKALTHLAKIFSVIHEVA